MFQIKVVYAVILYHFRMGLPRTARAIRFVVLDHRCTGQVVHHIKWDGFVDELICASGFRIYRPVN